MARYAGKHVYTGDDLSENLDKMNFGRAFAKARQILGAGGVFEWQGKKYTTDWKSESKIPVREGETPLAPQLLRRPPEGVPMRSAQNYGPPSGNYGFQPYDIGTPWKGSTIQSAVSPVRPVTPPVQNTRKTVDHFTLRHGPPGYMDTAPEQSILPPLQSEVPLPQPYPEGVTPRNWGGSTDYSQGPWRQYPDTNTMAKLRSILGR